MGKYDVKAFLLHIQKPCNSKSGHQINTQVKKKQFLTFTSMATVKCWENQQFTIPNSTAKIHHGKGLGSAEYASSLTYASLSI